jgi:hypothetical protein
VALKKHARAKRGSRSVEAGSAQANAQTHSQAQPSRSTKVLPTEALSTEDVEGFSGHVLEGEVLRDSTVSPTDSATGPGTGGGGAGGGGGDDDGNDKEQVMAAGPRHEVEVWMAEAREQFNVGHGEHERARQHRRREQEVRADFLGRHDDTANAAAMSEPDNLRLLRLNSQVAAHRYIQSLRESNILAPGFNDDEREQQLTARQKLYVKMMVVGSVAPLRNGVSTNNVIQSLGAFTTMMILSQDFRTELGGYFEPLRDRMQERIDNKARSEGAWAQQHADRRNGALDERTRRDLDANPDAYSEPVRDVGWLAGQDARRFKKGDFLSKRWQRRLDDLERRERGHRDLYTTETAAMTEVGLMENAFHKMREAGLPDDADLIAKTHMAMVKRLKTQFADDGLDQAAINKAARTILGQRLEAEPELAAVFNGMAHGKYLKTEPHEERITGTDHTRTVWTGEFHDHLGREVPDDVMFTVRRPMTPAEHQAACGELIKERMLHDLTTTGVDGFNDSFAGYMVGWAVNERNRSEDPALHLDGDLLPDGLKHRVAQTDSMLASMAADGFDHETRRRVYSNAYVDAIEELRHAHPDFARDWDRQFGSTWQQTMKEAVANPQGYPAGRMRDNSHTWPQSQADDPAAPESENDDEYQPV